MSTKHKPSTLSPHSQSIQRKSDAESAGITSREHLGELVHTLSNVKDSTSRSVPHNDGQRAINANEHHVSSISSLESPMTMHGLEPLQGHGPLFENSHAHKDESSRWIPVPPSHPFTSHGHGQASTVHAHLHLMRPDSKHPAIPSSAHLLESNKSTNDQYGHFGEEDPDASDFWLTLGQSNAHDQEAIRTEHPDIIDPKLESLPSKWGPTKHIKHDSDLAVAEQSQQGSSSSTIHISNRTPTSSTGSSRKATKTSKRVSEGSAKRVPGKGYPCTIPGCEIICRAPSKLAEHLGVHRGERQYKCDHGECDSAFVRSQDLIRHKKIHTKIKQFVCSFPGCGAASKRKDGLKSHERCHIGDVQHPCDVVGCEASYKTKNALGNHRMRDHT